MQTRDNAEKVVFIQADFVSQAVRDLQYVNRRQKNGQKTSKGQNQKADGQKYQQAGRNRGRNKQSKSHKSKSRKTNTSEGAGNVENQNQSVSFTKSEITGVQGAWHR